MNHTAQIQKEFVKEARKWDDLTYEEQKGYLSRHPASKRKITAKQGMPSKKKLKEKLEKRIPGSKKEKVDAATTERQQKLKERAEERKKEKDISKRQQERAVKKSYPPSPVLDKALGKLYTKYVALFEAHGPISKYNESSPVTAKINQMWKAAFPSEKIEGEYVFDAVERELGLASKSHGPGRKKGKPTRKTLPTKEEFIDAMKETFINTDREYPKVEGEKDPLIAENKKYGFSEPISGSERTRLTAIEESLPDDQKKFAKHLVVKDRTYGVDDRGHDWNGQRELVDTSDDRPIIKSTYNSPNYTDKREITHFLVPITSRFAVKNWARGIGGLEYAQFDTLEKAKAGMSQLPEQETKAKLRNEIEELTKKINKTSETIIKEGYGENDPPSGSTVRMIARSILEAPREDVYSTNYNSQGKVIGKSLYRKGREFLLTPEQQKQVVKVISNPSSASAEDIVVAKEHFDYFVDDLESNKDLQSEYDKKYLNRFLQHKDKYKKAIDKIEPIVILRQKLSDQHGHQTKEDVKLPEGFEFADKPTMSHEFSGADFFVKSKDGDIEMAISTSEPAVGGYSPVYGEVFYKVPGQDGLYTLGRRGVDSGLDGDWNDDVNDVINEAIGRVREKQDRISRSVTVSVGKSSWHVTPENLEKMKEKLRNGKTVTFMPHGFGTGYYVKARLGQPTTETEQIFGLPISVSSFDAD